MPILIFWSKNGHVDEEDEDEDEEDEEEEDEDEDEDEDGKFITILIHLQH